MFLIHDLQTFAEQLPVPAELLRRGSSGMARLRRRRWRLRLLYPDGFCSYCGTRLEEPTIDHVHPVVRGGLNIFDNLVPSCWPCNKEKGAQTLLLFLWRRAA